MPDIKLRDEYLFITYDDVIKSLKPYVLNVLNNDKYKEKYKDKIDYSKIENKSIDDLFKIVFPSSSKDILHTISLTEFDYESEYNKILYEENPDIIKKAKLLSMGRSIKILLTQPYIKKIYIYSKEFKQEIYDDLLNVYDKTKRIEYISGDIEEVLDFIPENITFYALNDVNILKLLIERNKKLTGVNIMVALLGYNYTLNKNNLPELNCEDVEKSAYNLHFDIHVFNPDPEINF